MDVATTNWIDHLGSFQGAASVRASFSMKPRDKKAGARDYFGEAKPMVRGPRNTRKWRKLGRDLLELRFWFPLDLENFCHHPNLTTNGALL